MKNMTIAQVLKASKKSKYLLLRYSTGHLIGINSGVVDLAIKKSKKNKNSSSPFCSYLCCDIHEYINHKIGFAQN